MKKKFDRFTAFLVIVIMIFGTIISRLVYIQLINGDDYREMAESMGEKPQVEIAPRGEILDRNGKRLAINTLNYVITYTYEGNNKDSSEINNSLVNALEIIYKNGDQDKIIMDSFPINYDASKQQFSYNFSAKNKYELVKQIENFKKNNKIETAFNKVLNYKTLEDFDKNLKNSAAGTSQDEAIKGFEEKYLTTFNESDDAKEVFYKLAEKYNFISRDSSGNVVYNYKTLSENLDKLIKAVALRYSLKSAEYRQYDDIEIARNVKKETAWSIQIKSDELKGITSQVVPVRYYPYGEVGSAFLGYMGKISNAQKYESLGYDISKELVGVSGLEYVLENRENNNYDIQLRGEPGVRYVKVDKFGKVIEETARIEAIPGDTVETTINIDMQAAAEKALDEAMAKIRNGSFGDKFRAQRGAAVAMDIHTGEILALASRPGFDPNYFALTGSPQDPEIIKKYQLNNPEELYNDKYDTIPRPMFNYATQGAVMPGSTFKPFSAIAGLEEGVITKNTTVYDDGIWDNIPGVKIRNWNYNAGGMGVINVTEALKRSSNYFFAEVGNRLGFEKFSEWARKFGLTRDENGKRPSTGIEITENPGSVGTPEESKRRAAQSAMRSIVEKLKEQKYGGYTIDYGTVYYNEIFDMLVDGNYDEKVLDELGFTNKNAKNFIKGKVNYVQNYSINKIDVLNMAIGQGYVSLTPVQMAQYLSTILNGGTRYRAHLVKRVLNPDGTVKKEIEPEVLGKIDLKPENIETVMEGMGKVTQELGGTARSTFSNYPIKTGGKTGTAQPGVGEIMNYRDNYAWFISFAPFDKPEIVVATVIYDGGHGGYAAGVAREIYDVYFKDRPEMQDFLAKKAQSDKSN
ncbi:penicillin-binding transpeptidase domain-containing protein [Fonticella tunisiensis]|uniref:Penicillin-binding protein 2 n=1 Tax=Fonticella tunisiensis TaxID=1096341 RepID=A0A4R7KU99_9CLOT|nr:penicillin-binding transpeptidase domain-containing protein [Fonticella tunisiensis]TDT63629.1 penicillin-binding protein 2 [Fonticella tunisiensis]